MAREILRAVISEIPLHPASAAHYALDSAIFTDRAAWPEQTVTDLSPILNGR
jgi:hypothetical protein